MDGMGVVEDLRPKVRPLVQLETSVWAFIGNFDAYVNYQKPHALAHIHIHIITLVT